MPRCLQPLLPLPLGGQSPLQPRHDGWSEALQVIVQTLYQKDHTFNSHLLESCFLSYKDEICMGCQSWE